MTDVAVDAISPKIDIAGITVRGGSYGALSTIANYIPGAGAVSGAIGMASSAQSDADNLQKASNTMTGNSAHSDNSLRFSFNERDVVTDWHLY